jgi:hypothetical protein
VLIEFEERVSEARNKLDFFTSQCESLQAKSSKLFKHLIEDLQKSEEKNHCKNCVWLAEQRYLSAAATAADFQRSLGSYLQIFWQDTIMLECMRISSVKKAMKAFIDLQGQVFVSDSQTVLESLEKVEEKRPENLKDTRLFKEEEFLVLKELGIEEDFIVQLGNWSPQSIRDFEWVIKEGPILIENGVFQQWQECFGLIVKSRFLHVFHRKPGFPFEEPIDSVYLAQAKLMVSQSSDYYVEITENSRNGILNKFVHGKQMVIKTKDPDVLNEWMELILSLK